MKAVYLNGLTLKFISESECRKYRRDGNAYSDKLCLQKDKNGFWCTCESGHDGPHIACGQDDDGTITVIAVWDKQT